MYMKPSGRTQNEIRNHARERFFEKNGYYPTEEDIIRLVKEARQAIRAKKEEAIRLADEAGKAAGLKEDTDQKSGTKND